MKRPIGMALGGGASRGSAHAGVLKALQEYPQLAPDVISGSSVGSIVATLYACGMQAETIITLAEKIRWIKNVIRFPNKRVPTSDFGFFSNSGLQEFINDSIGNRSIQDTEIPLIITACDLQKRKRVLFTDPHTAKTLNRDLLEAYIPPPSEDLPGIETIIIDNIHDIGLMVCASCSIPQMFRPVKVQEFELSDGGILDQIPVNPLQAYGAKTVSAVSLGLIFVEDDNIMAPMMASFAIKNISHSHNNLKKADIPIYLKELEGTSIIQTGDHSLISFAYDRAHRAFDHFLAQHR